MAAPAETNVRREAPTDSRPQLHSRAAGPTASAFLPPAATPFRLTHAGGVPAK